MPYLANTAPDPALIAQWVEQFHRDGFLFLPSVLTPEITAELRADLQRGLAEQVGNGGTGEDRVLRRMFEFSPANVRLFDLEPIVTFAETLVARDCHVIHNNSFQTRRGGLAFGWHQDDAPHYLVTHGEPPTNIRLPVLWFTVNYYLTDVPSIEDGATRFIRGSHMIGKPCPIDPTVEGYGDRVFDCVGPAGSAVIFNNQTWHTGPPVKTDRDRQVTQVTYARRMIGHKYFPFMNYVMPEHVYRDANPRLKRLLGFLPAGAYG